MLKLGSWSDGSRKLRAASTVSVSSSSNAGYLLCSSAAPAAGRNRAAASFAHLRPASCFEKTPHGPHRWRTPHSSRPSHVTLKLLHLDFLARAQNIVQPCCLCLCLTLTPSPPLDETRNRSLHQEFDPSSPETKTAPSEERSIPRTEPNPVPQRTTSPPASPHRRTHHFHDPITKASFFSLDEDFIVPSAYGSTGIAR
jgi:hypothetical protein